MPLTRNARSRLTDLPRDSDKRGWSMTNARSNFFQCTWTYAFLGEICRLLDRPLRILWTFILYNRSRYRDETKKGFQRYGFVYFPSEFRWHNFQFLFTWKMYNIESFTRDRLQKSIVFFSFFFLILQCANLPF